jgi:hypothetical protein
MGTLTLLVSMLMLARKYSMVESREPSYLTSIEFKAKFLWREYHAALRKHPLLTKSATSVVFASLSDAIAQRIEQTYTRKWQSDALKWQTSCRDENLLLSNSTIVHNWRRTRDVAITGFTWSGPSAHYWHYLMESRIHTSNKFLRLLHCLALDAILFSPVTGQIN